jgi:hypothetical protein
MSKVRVLAGLFAGVAMCLTPAISSAGVFVSINIAPPVLRTYEQPLCPTDGYLWTPGYWAYGQSGYYWVDGAWVAPPQAGFLWTPGYWGFASGIYSFNAGYWGPTVGYYGGVNYGFGYGGRGFDGGRWQGSHFAYNTAVSRVNTSVIHNTYVQQVSYGTNHASFNGPGGVSARPTSQQATLARQHQQASFQAPRAQTAAGNTGAGRTFGQPARVAAARPAAAPAERNRPQAQSSPRQSVPRPQMSQRAAPQAAPQQRPQQVRAAAPSRQAPQQRPQPQTRAAAPQRAPAQARPQGKEERK